MATLEYKCPSCGGPLKFNPETQNFTCEYCFSSFSDAQVQQMYSQKEQQQTRDEREVERAEQQKAQAAQQGEDSGDYAVSYSCPSCGAEVVTDETTAATFCYYCHNPVVLEGRVSGEFLPDKIIPFQFDKDNGFEVSAFVGDKLLNGCLVHPRVAAVDSRRFLLTVIGFTYSGIFRPRIILCSFVRKLRHHF